ncbi:MAG: AbrB/MazE/SpoVT family DNA-binding domain-containing protein [Thermoplasmataceae archaeon]
MKIRIGRSGNAITLRIPMDIRRSWDLKYGDMVDLRENDDGEKLIISKLGGSK